MTPLRRAIVRAAPTCTLWEPATYGTARVLVFAPAHRLVLMWNRAVPSWLSWTPDYGTTSLIITRAELFVAGADVSHLEG